MNLVVLVGMFWMRTHGTDGTYVERIAVVGECGRLHCGAPREELPRVWLNGRLSAAELSTFNFQRSTSNEGGER